MAPDTKNPARLIAIDGSRGADVAKSTSRLVEALRARGITCAVSHWDASGLFGELGHSGERHTASPRTLSLVYAADLAFRLRWEIRPALDSGAVVIAAPYLETAIAFGGSCGLPAEWLRELLRFAPQPDVQGLARERKLARPWKGRLDRGYPEYCAALFEPAMPGVVSKHVRADTIGALDTVRGRRVYRLSADGLRNAARAVARGRAV